MFWNRFSVLFFSFSFAFADQEINFLCNCVICTEELGKDSDQGNCHSSIHQILQNGIESESDACIQVVHDRPKDCGGCNPLTCFRLDHPMFQTNNRRRMDDSREFTKKDQIRRLKPRLASSRTLDALRLGRQNGTSTVNGMHNPESNGNPTFMTEWVNRITGEDPGLYSADFLYTREEVANRGIVIDEAIKQWEKGSIINMMWHACPPHHPAECWWDEDGVLRTLEDWEWHGLFDANSWLHSNLNLMLDAISLHLFDLKDAGVELMFRPFHEMNQPLFWW